MWGQPARSVTSLEPGKWSDSRFLDAVPCGGHSSQRQNGSDVCVWFIHPRPSSWPNWNPAQVKQDFQKSGPSLLRSCCFSLMRVVNTELCVRQNIHISRTSRFIFLVDLVGRGQWEGSMGGVRPCRTNVEWQSCSFQDALKNKECFI